MLASWFEYCGWCCARPLCRATGYSIIVNAVIAKCTLFFTARFCPCVCVCVCVYTRNRRGNSTHQVIASPPSIQPPSLLCTVTIQKKKCMCNSAISLFFLLSLVCVCVCDHRSTRLNSCHGRCVPPYHSRSTILLNASIYVKLEKLYHKNVWKKSSSLTFGPVWIDGLESTLNRLKVRSFVNAIKIYYLFWWHFSFYFAKLQRLCVCAQWLSYKSIDETTVFFYNLGWPALRWFDWTATTQKIIIKSA